MLFLYFYTMLQIQNIQFSYQQDKVIQNISFEVNEGQNIAILGESGCGKSTLLKLIYGLHDLQKGQILFENKPILGPKFNLISGHNDMKYLAQDFDLMPFISVSENIGKFLSNTDKIKKQARINELLEIVEMAPYANTKAQFLSGGQQQRVAIARVLALEPKLMLLDEPFSHIDNFRKNALRRNLFGYLKNKKITCLVATHDCIDALSFADKTLVINNGYAVDFRSSFEIYNNPKTKYTASLFGEVNEINTKLFNLNLNDEVVFVYPHQLKINANSEFRVRVRQSFFKGSHYLIKAVLNKQIIFFESDKPLVFNEEIGLEKI